MALNKIVGLICVFGGLVAVATNSQVLATVMLTNGIIVSLWYLKEG